MSILLTAVLALATNNEHDLELASALARRGWVELAEDVVGRIDKNQTGLPLVLAELSFAKARRESDVRRAAKELDLAVERLTRAGRAPTLDERGMTGWLHIQKAKILTQAADEDAALRPEALKAWEATEAYYVASVAAIEKLAPGRAVDEALLDARLEIPKAMASQARVPSIDDARRKKLLEESIRLLSEFMLVVPLQPVLLEAILEEGRVRADLKDFARAERCFRSLPRTARDIRARGYPMGDYVTAQLHAGALSLAQMLTPAGKPKDAVAACDEFLRDNPRLVRSAIGYLMSLAKADALYELKDEAGAIDLAQKVSDQDPDGAPGRAARAKVRTWTRGKNATPARLLSAAEGLLEKGRFAEALEDLKRCLELCTPKDLAVHEPQALFKRGICLRALSREGDAAVAFQEAFRKHPTHPLARTAAIEAVQSLSASGADDAAMENLLNEVEKLNLGGDADPLLKYLRARILEGRKQFKAAAELYLKIDEKRDFYDDALVSGGHCLRVDGQPASAEATLKKVLSRPAAAPRLLFMARYELALIALADRPKEALDHLEKGAALLPPESATHAQLLEKEIQALLALKDADGAATRLEKLLARFPDEASTVRACRRVAAQFETAVPRKAAKYYRVWLDRASTAPTTAPERQAVADGLYRIARALNKMGENVLSVTDLKGAPVADAASWRDALRAHDLVVVSGGLSEKDAIVASTRLLWCAGLAGDWAKSRAVAEKILSDQKLLKGGRIDAELLLKNTWLVGVCFENAHSLYQMGRAGQKFQFGNSQTMYNELVRVTAPGSESWWVANYMVAKVLFERGEGDDIKVAGGALSYLERNHPGFDGGRYGMAERLGALRDLVRAASGTQR